MLSILNETRDTHAPDVESQAPEIACVLLCARTPFSEDHARRLRAFAAAGLDWDRAIDFAFRHGLMPLLHLNVNATCPELVPPGPRARLREQFRRTSALNLFLAAELRSLLEAFGARGVEAILYKGPQLADSAYGSLALRQFYDLDLLVRKRDLPAVKEIMRGRGFVSHPDLGGGREEVIMRTQCNLTFARDDNRTIVETHWDVCPTRFSPALDAGSLWRRSREIDFRGVPARALSPEDLLLALCVHGAKHVWERLGWVCDIAQLVNAQTAPDYQLVLERARRGGAERMLLLGLALARDLLGARLPADLCERLAARRDVRALAASVNQLIFGGAGTAEGMSGYFSFQMRARERLREKMNYCRLALDPTDKDLASASLPRPLSFAYYLLRPLRLAVTGGPAQFRQR